jgi:NADH-quinone oxidoreductase subunit C
MSGKGFEEALHGLDAGPESAPAGADASVAAEADASAHPSVLALRARFGDAVLHHVVMAGDEHVVYVREERSLEVLRWLRSEPAEAYDYLADVTAVDYGGGRPLEVVYQLWSIQHRRALRIKVTLPLSALEIDSVHDIWKTSNWLEREVFDLFGIHFRGHPDLRRILMPEKYAEGHPLRKDFPLRGRFSRAEQTRRALAMAAEEYYSPEELRIAQEAGAEPVAADTAEAADSATRDAAWAAAEATARAAHARAPGKGGEWALDAQPAAGGAAAPPEVTE